MMRFKRVQILGSLAFAITVLISGCGSSNSASPTVQSGFGCTYTGTLNANGSITNPRVNVSNASSSATVFYYSIGTQVFQSSSSTYSTTGTFSPATNSTLSVSVSNNASQTATCSYTGTSTGGGGTGTSALSCVAAGQLNSGNALTPNSYAFFTGMTVYIYNNANSSASYYLVNIPGGPSGIESTYSAFNFTQPFWAYVNSSGLIPLTITDNLGNSGTCNLQLGTGSTSSLSVTASSLSAQVGETITLSSSVSGTSFTSSSPNVAITYNQDASKAYVTSSTAQTISVVATYGSATQTVNLTFTQGSFTLSASSNSVMLGNPITLTPLSTTGAVIQSGVSYSKSYAQVDASAVSINANGSIAQVTSSIAQKVTIVANNGVSSQSIQLNFMGPGTIGYSVSLSANATQAAINTSVTLTALANGGSAPTATFSLLSSSASGAVLTSLGNGQATLTSSVAQTVTVVAYYNGVASNPVSVNFVGGTPSAVTCTILDGDGTLFYPLNTYYTYNRYQFTISGSDGGFWAVQSISLGGAEPTQNLSVNSSTNSFYATFYFSGVHTVVVTAINPANGNLCVASRTINVVY